MAMKPADKSKARVFISHSSEDKAFVRRLVKRLSDRKLEVWFDEHDIRPGDSIVDSVGAALDAAAYVVVVLSEHSVLSLWVKAELNAALMKQLSNQGVVVLPVRIDDCKMPTMLADRLFVDFRSDFEVGIKKLAEVLEQESPRQPQVQFHMDPPEVAHCYDTLAVKPDADVRRLLHKRFARGEIRAVWHEVLGSDMDDEVPRADHLGCALELVIRSRRENKMTELYLAICADKPGSYK